MAVSGSTFNAFNGPELNVLNGSNLIDHRRTKQRLFKRMLLKIYHVVFLLGCLIPQTIASSDVVVIVSAKSSVPNISRELAGHLFLRKISTLPGVGRVETIELPRTSETKKIFNQRVLKKTGLQLRAYWARLFFTGKAKKPRVAQNDAHAVELIANNPGLVGYVGADYVTEKVRVIYLAD